MWRRRPVTEQVFGWKPAATVHGAATERLLDTHTSERHPVGAAILDWSRAQVATMKPGSTAPALRQLVHELLSTTDGTALAYRKTTGFNRYNLGSAQPLVGSTALDFHFEDGTRLGDLLRQGRGVVLDFTGDHALKCAAKSWQGRIRYATGTGHTSRSENSSLTLRTPSTSSSIGPEPSPATPLISTEGPRAGSGACPGWSARPRSPRSVTALGKPPDPCSTGSGSTTSPKPTTAPPRPQLGPVHNGPEPVTC
ncbi:hypothetical protein ABZ622_22200 [Streptomyces sp. NPDC007164]|uniref:aromatic-ring hydroxylase C-terminal domain-containing protein n=1 Tax=Streptomyces sp. NPDC007164 TaxID=3156918 RepID=UPI0033DB97B6